MKWYENISRRNKKYLSIAVLIVGLFVTASLLLSPIIKSKIIAEIPESIQYDDLDVQLWNESLTLTNLRYLPADSVKNDNQFSAKFLRLQGLGWMEFLFNNCLSIQYLEGTDLEGTFVHDKYQSTPDSTSDSDDNLKFESIVIKDISLKNVNFTYVGKKKEIFNAKNLNLDLNQMRYALDQPDDALKFKGFEISIAEADWLNEKESYDLSVKKLLASSDDKSLNVKDLKLIPRYGEDDWKNHFSTKNSRLNLTVPNLQIEGLDWFSVIDGKRMMSQKMVLENSVLEVLSTPSLPACDGCHKELLHEKLLNTNFPIHFDEVVLNNNKIILKIPDVVTTETATLIFSNVNGSVKNITNIPEKIEAQPNARAVLTATVQQSSQLATTIDFRLNDPTFGYAYEATLDNMDLQKFSNLLHISKNVRIKSGQLHKLHFKVDGNNQVATGNMDFQYEDLSINIFKKQRKKPLKFLSKIVNFLVIKSKDDMEEDGYKVAKMHYDYKTNRGTFHQWWGTIRSGFRSAILPDWLNKEELE